MSRSRLLAPTALLCAVLTSLFAMAASDDSVSTGSTWLDAKPLPTWNTSGARLPKALPGDGQSLRTGRCARFARKPTTASDRALVKAGWTLLGPLQVFDTTEVITAAAEGDGMCRAMGFQVFVFVDGRFAGTLAPEPMTDRFDGAMGEVRLYSPRNLTATVRRYAADDPLCCPSRQGSVQYELQPGPKGPVVTATQATTSPTPPQ
ncbi:LppP/LprE family lipoprotein [Myxococcus sp. CA051A]|uniref:LppP/LprE family lipoprotein n=1 Tax=Myxococcus llanfairpwllgwyngyllgogerychwyrndrobwllllantysiliogogogochensis TaxID=2590453 RepID=A0A540WSH5_9BACT|nr:MULTISPECIES: LppP/LprE family lipoprotein [Myxococcus]NTX61760.1 LppP/LprE family lipoprotein [Myxococcus sp. CA051A]TQF11959.1 LppP/LprE family lipoprotein [Myxococcus llanfairpwllgwyngyllgogerychwyrndrobwllllantysiliogogogochensis]